MAIDPSSLYTVQVDTSTDPVGYPYGKPQNDAVLGDGTGTPLESGWVADLWGFLQSLLSAGSVTPSGTPDKVGASQYLGALTTLFATDAEVYAMGLDVAALETFATETPSTIYTSSVHSNLVNISAVSSTDAIIVIRRGNYVTAHAYFTVTNSVTGQKSFDFTLPYMLGDFAEGYHLSGSGAVYSAAGNHLAMVYAVTGSQRARCEWYSTDVAGTVPVRLDFGYYIGVP